VLLGFIDWLAVYDATTGRCFYVPARELGDGVRDADDYETLPDAG